MISHLLRGLYLSSFLFYSKPGHQYFVVSPFGSETAIVESGYKLVLPFSRIDEFQKFIDKLGRAHV